MSDDTAAAFERLRHDLKRVTAERDRAREECGVQRSRAENYQREMYIYLRKYMALTKENA